MGVSERPSPAMSHCFSYRPEGRAPPLPKVFPPPSLVKGGWGLIVSRGGILSEPPFPISSFYSLRSAGDVRPGGTRICSTYKSRPELISFLPPSQRCPELTSVSWAPLTFNPRTSEQFSFEDPSVACIHHVSVHQMEIQSGTYYSQIDCLQG